MFEAEQDALPKKCCISNCSFSCQTDEEMQMHFAGDHYPTGPAPQGFIKHWACAFCGHLFRSQIECKLHSEYCQLYEESAPLREQSAIATPVCSRRNSPLSPGIIAQEVVRKLSRTERKKALRDITNQANAPVRKKARLTKPKTRTTKTSKKAQPAKRAPRTPKPGGMDKKEVIALFLDENGKYNNTVKNSPALQEKTGWTRPALGRIVTHLKRKHPSEISLSRKGGRPSIAKDEELEEMGKRMASLGYTETDAENELMNYYELTALNARRKFKVPCQNTIDADMKIIMTALKKSKIPKCNTEARHKTGKGKRTFVSLYVVTKALAEC
jgi:hypothetical protein